MCSTDCDIVCLCGYRTMQFSCFLIEKCYDCGVQIEVFTTHSLEPQKNIQLERVGGEMGK